MKTIRQTHLQQLRTFLADFNIEFTTTDDLYVSANRIFQVKEPLNVHSRYAGEFIGTVGKSFRPSHLFLDRLKVGKTVTVDAKTAWLFVCGRDIFMKSLPPHSYKIGDKIAVLDYLGDVLGYGTLSKKGLQNAFDRGEILRQEFTSRTKNPS